MGQKWRIYAPEGRNTSGDVKMNLRTMSKCAPSFGRGEIFVSPVSINDYGDDVYTLEVNSEKVMVVDREREQTIHKKDVFDNLDEGIFFQVSEDNARAAESKLVNAFG
jgi:hypothetical protein